MASHVVVYGQGAQTISFVPSIRVPSMTYSIEDFVPYSSGSSDRNLASGNATLDALDTTTDQTSGLGQSDPRKVFVAATTNVTASHRYVITDVDSGIYEHFTADGVYGDNYIVATTPLLRSYPTGSAVQGIRFTASVPASVCDDQTLLQLENPLRVVWTYTASGSLNLVQEQITILRATDNDMGSDEVMQMMEEAWPDFSTRFNDGYKLRNAVKFAKDDLNSRILGKGMRPEEILYGSQGTQALFWRTMMHLAMFGDVPGNRSADDFRAECKGMFDDVFGDLTTGKMGQEVAEIDRDLDKGVANENTRRKSVIGSL